MITDIHAEIAFINQEIKNTQMFLALNPSPEEELKLEELLILLLQQREEKLDELYSPQKRTA